MQFNSPNSDDWLSVLFFNFLPRRCELFKKGNVYWIVRIIYSFATEYDIHNSFKKANIFTDICLFNP